MKLIDLLDFINRLIRLLYFILVHHSPT